MKFNNYNIHLLNNNILTINEWMKEYNKIKYIQDNVEQIEIICKLDQLDYDQRAWTIRINTITHTVEQIINTVNILLC